jgi:hypothetical protein
MGYIPRKNSRIAAETIAGNALLTQIDLPAAYPYALRNVIVFMSFL